MVTISHWVCYEDYSNTEIDETKLNITSDHDGPVEVIYLLTSLGMFPKLKHLEIWIVEKTYFEFSVWNDPPVLLPNLFNIAFTIVDISFALTTQRTVFNVLHQIGVK